jgi:indolepyruvate ferredoxin oxidoreductase
MPAWDGWRRAVSALSIAWAQLRSSRELATPPAFDASYALEDRYRIRSGRVFLTGNQALVRLPLMQRRRDLEAGLNTAGFISGYRGSPLGIFDMNLWQATEILKEHEIHFEPGLNEDLAATAVWGSQQATLLDGPKVDGVFGMWYGKGPGVDRACDALKHANYAGTAANGGVLALMGDDPGAKSSSIAHQSEPAMMHCGIPVLNPSSVQDYLDFGLYGWALSRYSGCWVGLKCLTDTIESSGSIEVDPDRAQIVIPSDFEMPPGGLNVGWGNLPLQVEARLFDERLVAVRAFARANGIDQVALEGATRRLGIVTTGKAYGDLRQDAQNVWASFTILTITQIRCRVCFKCIGSFPVSSHRRILPSSILSFISRKSSGYRHGSMRQYAWRKRRLPWSWPSWSRI